MKKIRYDYNMKKVKRLLDAYRFPGFRPLANLKGKFGDNKARIIQLARLEKKLSVVVAEQFPKAFMTGKKSWSETYLAETPEFIYRWKSDELIV